MPTHTLKLLRREEAAESTMSFYFDKPAGFQFKPSQYLDCSLRDPAETEAEAGSDLTWRVDVVVASTIEAISPVVDQLMHSLKTSCCPPEQEIAVEMALREALANAIVHGNHEDLHKKVRVCCACDAKRGMLIVVKDQGEGFDPSKIPSPLARQSILSEHGRGIFLINLLMDEVQFQKGGTEIRMRKYPHATR